MRYAMGSLAIHSNQLIAVMEHVRNILINPRDHMVSPSRRSCGEWEESEV